MLVDTTCLYKIIDKYAHSYHDYKAKENVSLGDFFGRITFKRSTSLSINDCVVDLDQCFLLIFGCLLPNWVQRGSKFSDPISTFIEGTSHACWCKLRT